MWYNFHMAAEELDYRSFEKEFGEMFHLVLDRIDTNGQLKFVADKDYPKYATVDNQPIFLNFDKELCTAVDYTIVYPKVYVKKYRRLKTKEGITRSYLH